MAVQNEQYEMIMMETLDRTEKTVSVLNGEYITIRAGRANPHVLDKIMVDYYVEHQSEIKKNKRLNQYMKNYLEIVTTVSSVLALRSESEENLEKKKELWKYIKTADKSLYNWMRRGILGNVMNLPGKPGRKVSVNAYRIAQKIFKFN